MSEGLINLVDDDSSRDVHGHEAHAGEDRLATTRPPAGAHAPPPPPPSRRPIAHAAGVLVPPPRPSSPGGAGGPGMLYPSEPPAALPRTSWWRSLIASTLAPADVAREERGEKRIGLTCVGLALAFAVASLIVGLRPAPGDATSVAVAVIASRTAIALGLNAFGYALLRMGERFLKLRAPRRDEDGRSPPFPS